MSFLAGAIIGKMLLDNSQFMQGLSSTQQASVKTGAVILTALGGAMATTAKTATEFSKQVSNVSTLLDGMGISTKDIRDNILKMNPELGSSIELTKGLYQSFSAGASSMTEAMQTTKDSAMFAKAALTDTFTAVDVLTTAVNAYGKEVVSTTQASDIFFTTIKKGKITGEELSATIGQSIPLFSSAKIKLEELASGMAAMTKVGVSASESTTQLNAIVNSFLKPSEALVKILQQQGYESGSAFLATEGLAGALKILEDATGGDAAKLAELLPNIRALRGAMALTGVGGKEFTNILAEMANASGATATAFGKQEKLYDTLKNTFEKTKIIVGELSKSIIDQLATGITVALESFNQLPEPIQNGVVVMLGLTAAITGVVLVLPALKAGFMALGASTGPLYLVAAAIGAIIGVGIGLKQMFDKMETDRISKQYQRLAEDFGLAEKELVSLVKAAESVNTSAYAFAELQKETGLATKELKNLIKVGKDLGLSNKEIIDLSKNTNMSAKEIKNLSEGIQQAGGYIDSEMMTANQAINLIADSFGATKEEVAAIVLKTKDVNAALKEQATIIQSNATSQKKAVDELWLREQFIANTKKGMTDKAALEEATRKQKEQARALEIQQQIESRNQAQQEYTEAQRSANEANNLGLTTDIEKTEELLELNKNLVKQIIEIGHGYTAIDKDPILQNALAEVKRLEEELEKLKKKGKETPTEWGKSWDSFFEKSMPAVEQWYGSISNGLTYIANQTSESVNLEYENLQKELDYKYGQQEAALNETLDTQNAAYDAQAEKLKQQLDDNLISQEKYDSELSKMDEAKQKAAQEIADQKTELEKKQKQEQNELSRKQFEADKANKIGSTIMNGANAILGWWKAAAELGPFAGPIFGGVMTALTLGYVTDQVAKISAQKFVPEFATGGKMVGDGLARLNERGGEIQYLRDGTTVIPSDLSRQIVTDANTQKDATFIFNNPVVLNDQMLDTLASKFSNIYAKQMRLAR